MRRDVIRIAAVLAAALVFVMGQGMVGTLLSAEGKAAHFSHAALGWIGSGYYMGFVLACLAAPALIARVSEKKAFQIAAALAALAACAYPLLISPQSWFVLRTLIGLSVAILYVIVESSLNSFAANTNRGRVFGSYAIVKQVASLTSQSILVVAGRGALRAFYLAGALYLLSAVPVSVARTSGIVSLPQTRLEPVLLWRLAPSGVFVCMVAGFANGAIWSLAPAFGAEHGFPHGLAGAFMGSFILGGALVQIPLGWLSDRMDRRHVMLGASGVAVLTGCLLAGFAGQNRALALVLMTAYAVTTTYFTSNNRFLHLQLYRFRAGTSIYDDFRLDFDLLYRGARAEARRGE